MIFNFISLEKLFRAIFIVHILKYYLAWLTCSPVDKIGLGNLTFNQIKQT